jgi:aminopeptidase N/puromycin-sensitive aminopeptidase
VKTLLTPELGGSLVCSTGSFCSVEDRDDVSAFFATHKVPAAEHALQHAIEHINGCIELRSLQQPNLDKWLAAQPKQ